MNAAKNFRRPIDPNTGTKNTKQFRNVMLFRIDELFVAWAQMQKLHFADGIIFDQIHGVK